MARLTKKDWLEEGINILSEFAQHKLRILYLCERLGVTRGSFYHHFKGIEEYISELLKSWEEENTLHFIKNANKGATAEEKMDLLNKQVMQTNQAVETAIRSWSFYHPSVQEHLARVDKIRITFLQGIFEEMGKDKVAALQHAKLDYALLIGIQQLYPNAGPEEMKNLFETYMSR